ncbi:MAG: DUF2125 domain-containing protein [Hyphomicrobiales bacterium]
MVDRQTGKERPASRLRLYLAPALLLALALALSIGWLILSRQVETKLDAVIAEEAVRGRLWSCDDRRIAGYPFRIEIECINARIKDSGSSQSEARLSRLGAVAQVYDPTLIIIEAQAPLLVFSKDQPIARVEWSSLRSSVHISGGETDRLSISGDGVSVKTQLNGQPSNLALAHGELHFRIKPENDKPSNHLEFVAKADGASSDVMPGHLANIELAGTVEQGIQFLNYKGIESLETWRQAKGRVQLDAFKFTRGEQNLEVKGMLGLDDQRKPSGQIEVSGKGLEDLFRSQGLSKLSGLQTSNVKVPLIFTKGLLLLGPFKVAELQPLY